MRAWVRRMRSARPACQSSSVSTPLKRIAGFPDIFVDIPAGRLAFAVLTGFVQYLMGQLLHLSNVGLASAAEVPANVLIQRFGATCLGQVAADPACRHLAQGVQPAQMFGKHHGRITDAPVTQSLQVLRMGLYLNLIRIPVGSCRSSRSSALAVNTGRLISSTVKRILECCAGISMNRDVLFWLARIVNQSVRCFHQSFAVIVRGHILTAVLSHKDFA